MNWHTPNSLWLLWLLPIVGWLLQRALRKRQAAGRAFSAGSMRTRVIPQFSAGRTWIKMVLLLSGLACLMVAAARPKYGVYYEQVSQRGVDLFVLLDVSRSMLAQDIAPNRLERAESDILDLLQRIPTDRVGLIVFAGKAMPRVPLTNDHTFFRQMLRDVDTDSAPVGGSLIGDAIRAALSSMQQRADRDQVIVLITDGEDHDSFPLDAAKLAAERGVKIITVGLGDRREGARIPEQSDRADLGYVKDKDGQEVWSQMNEDLLKEIALMTSGAYVPARTMAYDLGQIYDDHLSGLTRSEIRSEKRQRFREQFQWFAGLGLALLLGDSLLTRGGATAGLLLAFLLLPAGTADANDVVSQSREAIKAFEAGDYAKSAELFRNAAKSLPDDPRIVFNHACAVAASDTPEAARDLFYQSALARDVRLSADSHYNLGCLASDQAKQILGETPLEANKEQRTESLELITRAMGHFRDALKSDPSHDSSRHNLETLRLWVKQMKALWEQKDRQQQQTGQDVLQLLKQMDAQQLALRSMLGEEAEKPDSPKRQEQIDKIQQQQRQLVDDVEPLKQKLIEQFATANQGTTPGSTSQADPSQLAQAQQALEQWTTSLRDKLVLAADRILEKELDAARQSQRDSLEEINQLYMAIAPFADVLQTAIPDQKSRIGRTKDLVSRGSEQPSSDDEQNVSQVKADVDELGWRQQRIGGWAAALVAKAEQQLPMLEQSLADQQSAALAGSNDPAANDPNDPLDPGTPDPPPLNSGRPATNGDSAPAADLAAMVESMRKAVELAPQVSELSRTAAQHLRDSDFEMALPQQEQALKLLEEIAAGLPKDQNQNQDGQDQDKQNENQNQNQNQNDQNGQNQDNPQNDGQQNQQPKGTDQQDPPPQDDSKQDPSQQDLDQEKNSDDEPQDADSQPDQQQPEEKNAEEQSEQKTGTDDSDENDSQRPASAMTSARIESILQRVRDRERQHRQIQKQLRDLLQKRARPERDW